MSSRRATEDTAASPDPKRAKTASSAAPPLDIAAIRAQIAARKFALSGGGNNASSSSTSPAPPAKPTSPAPAGPSQSVGPSALPPPPTMDSSVAERLAAAKARIEAMKARNQNPYLSGSGSMPSQPAAPTPQYTPATNSSIAMHPLLMGQQQQAAEQEKNEKKRERDRYKTMAPKFSTVRANQVATPPPGKIVPAAPALSLNPYAAGATAAAAASASAGAGAGAANSRRSRKMHLSAPGKYVKQGDALRNEEKLEALKQRIAEASRKAGLDSEFDTLERSLKVGSTVCVRE